MPFAHSAPPTEADSEFARKALQQIDAALMKSGVRAAKAVQVAKHRIQLTSESLAQAESVELPASVLKLLQEILAQVANGNAVTIVPIHAEFTTNEAADYLNVSRPFLVSLLNQGKIPFRMVGTHRRIRFESLAEYKRRDDIERTKLVDELANDAQLDGLY